MITSRQSKNPSYLLHTPYGYYFRLRIPSDLARILHETHLKISLLTGRKQEARQRAIRLVACAFDLFRSIRRGKSMDMVAIREFLRRDLWNQLVGRSVEEAMNPATDVEVLTRHLEAQTEHFKKQLADNQFSEEVLESARQIIESEDLPTREGSVSFKVLCRELLKYNIIYHEILIRRAHHDHLYEGAVLKSLSYEGDYVLPTADILVPVTPEPKAQNEVPSKKISELLPKFIDDLKLRRKSESYRIDCNIVIGKVVVQVLGDIPVSTIQTKDVDKFIGIMRKMPQNFTKKKEYRDIHPLKLAEMKHESLLGQSRVRTITFILSSFFQFCIRKGEMKFNPVVKGMAGPKPKKKGSSWTPEDLNKIFCSSEYLNDTFEDPYQFWIPVLGLFSGARHKELAQLYVEDVVFRDGIWGITIEEDPEDSDKSVKTENSKRFIPLHDFLVKDLGFVRYVDEVKRLNQKRVFYALKKWKAKGYRGQSSKWFGEWTDLLGVKAGGKNFHSFRHWFRTYMENYAKLNVYDIAPLLGHSDQKLMTLNYGEVMTATLRDRIMRIDYKKDIMLDLSHLKTSKFARPT